MKTIFAFSIILITLNVSATVRNVPNPYSTIQSALNACQDDDTVSVGAGTYFENVVWPGVLHIKLIGSGSASTIVDGNQMGTVISKSNSTPDSDILISGFTITNGLTNDSFPSLYASGVHLEYSGGKLEDLKIVSNTVGIEWTYGGGLSLSYSEFLIDNVTSSNNVSIAGSLSNGVGVCFENSIITMKNSKVENNNSHAGAWNNGGGVYCENSNVQIDNTIVRNNIQHAGMASQSDGGGIYSMNSSLHLNSCLISQNHSGAMAWVYGAGIYHAGNQLTMINTLVDSNSVDATTDNYSAGVYIEQCIASISGCEISYNSAHADNTNYSGGIGANYCQLIIENSKIQHNSLLPGSYKYLGAAMRLVDCNSTIVNTLVSSNTIDSIPFSAGFAGIVATADLSTSSLTMTHCTVADHNSFSSSYNSLVNFGELNISNCIIYGNTQSPDVITDSANITIEYNDIKGIVGGTGNISSDPLFVGQNDYHLTPTSPCAGAGNSLLLTDLELDIRPQPMGTNADMGAFEIDQVALEIPESVAPEIFEVWPIPARNYININFDANSTQVIRLFAVDILGRIVVEKTQEVFAGKNHLVIIFPEGYIGLTALTIRSLSGLAVKMFLVVR